jgi:hypothetical protein
MHTDRISRNVPCSIRTFAHSLCISRPSKGRPQIRVRRGSHMPTTRFGAACVHGAAVINGKAAAMTWPDRFCGGDVLQYPCQYIVYCILLLLLLLCIAWVRIIMFHTTSIDTFTTAANFFTLLLSLWPPIWLYTLSSLKGLWGCWNWGFFFEWVMWYVSDVYVMYAERRWYHFWCFFYQSGDVYKHVDARLFICWSKKDKKIQSIKITAYQSWCKTSKVSLSVFSCIYADELGIFQNKSKTGSVAMG